MINNSSAYVEEEFKAEGESIERDGGGDRSGSSERSDGDKLYSQEQKEYLSAASVKHKAGDDEYCVRWKKSKNMLELERLAKEAYDNGMNYGKYVAKENK